MAQLLAMQQQLAQQKQSAVPPAQGSADGHPDMAAMMAELQALRAQVASQKKPEAAVQPTAPEPEQQPKFEDIMKEFGHGEENEV